MESPSSTPAESQTPCLQHLRSRVCNWTVFITISVIVTFPIDLSPLRKKWWSLAYSWIPSIQDTQWWHSHNRHLTSEWCQANWTVWFRPAPNHRFGEKSLLGKVHCCLVLQGTAWDFVFTLLFLPGGTGRKLIKEFQEDQRLDFSLFSPRLGFTQLVNLGQLSGNIASDTEMSSICLLLCFFISSGTFWSVQSICRTVLQCNDPKRVSSFFTVNYSLSLAMLLMAAVGRVGAQKLSFGLGLGHRLNNFTTQKQLPK